MKLPKALKAVASLLVLASLGMFIASFSTGDRLAPAINTVQFILVLLSVFSSITLFFKLGKGTFGRPIWALISLSLLIVLAAVACELVNGYARAWRISQGTVFTIYLFTWLILVAIPFLVFFLFRRSGFEFKRGAYYSVIPPLTVVTVIAIVVVLVPLLRSDLDAGTKVSNFVSTLIQLAILFFVLFVAVTIGQGALGRPWLYLSLCVSSIVIQTIVSTHVIVVLGYMRVLEPANFFLHLGYFFLILAVARYLEILEVGSAPDS